MEYLKDRDRSMMLLVLDKIQASGDIKYLALLDDWARIYKKVAQRIGQVKAHLAAGAA